VNTDCIFCKIIAGEIPTEILYQDEDVIVFPDIKPVTPVHLLVVPRKHIPSLAQMAADETPIVGKMTRVANQLAREQGIAESGYRLTINSGADSGQIVPHLHMHFMGGRALKWSH
jgi:histidine triad (HIT) family protein